MIDLLWDVFTFMMNAIYRVIAKLYQCSLMQMLPLTHLSPEFQNLALQIDSSHNRVLRRRANDFA